MDTEHCASVDGIDVYLAGTVSGLILSAILMILGTETFAFWSATALIAVGLSIKLGMMLATREGDGHG